MSLRLKTISGVLWVSSSAFLSRGLVFLTILILAKILDPKDFGLVAIAALTINFLLIFRDFGINQAIIYSDQKKRYQYADTAFILLPVLSIVLYVIIFLLAPSISSFFDAPNSTSVIKVMSLNIVISSLSVVPMSLLEKDLAFKKRVIPEVSSAIIYIIVAVSLALMGFGVWSIVFASLSQNLLLSTLYLVISPWKPSLTLALDLQIAKEIFKYSKHVVLGALLIFTFTNLDNAFVGRLLGTSALGFYAFAYNIGNLPATQITHVINKVLFPTYSLIKTDLVKLKNAYLVSLRILSSITVLASIMIIILSSSFLITAYQDKWVSAIVPLQILGVYGFVRSLGATTGVVFLATGKPQKLPFYTAISLVVFLVLVYPLTIWFGITGTATAATIGLIIGTIMAFLGVNKIISIRTIELLSSQYPSISAGIITLAGVSLINRLTTLDEPGVIRLFLLSIIIVVVYSAALFFIDKQIRSYLVSAKEKIFEKLKG